MDVYEYAMKMEKDGEAYYRDLAKKAGNKGIEAIFNSLADSEVQHYQTLQKMKEKISVEHVKDTVIEDVKNIFQKMSDNAQDIEVDVSQIEVYKKALQIEKETEEFYRNKAAELTDPRQKEIFKKIADEEKKHLQTIDSIIEFISRPQDWLENAEWNHMDQY